MACLDPSIPRLYLPVYHTWVAGVCWSCWRFLLFGEGCWCAPSLWRQTVLQEPGPFLAAGFTSSGCTLLGQQSGASRVRTSGSPPGLAWPGLVWSQVFLKLVGGLKEPSTDQLLCCAVSLSAGTSPSNRHRAPGSGRCFECVPAAEEKPFSARVHEHRPAAGGGDLRAGWDGGQLFRGGVCCGQADR